MLNAWNQFWSAFAKLFSAFEKTASIAENVATVGEETSAAWVDSSRHERQAKALVYKKEIKAIKAE